MSGVPRLLISAAHKSSGKTTVSVGLTAALRARGLDIRTFKKGPDYIDPMWLARASGRSCYNLDFNTQEPDDIRALFLRGGAGAALALIEGNKGLHDGIDTLGSDSTAALAKSLAAPVVLVIDVEGITRGIAPLVLGHRMFDPEVAVKGAVLNRVASPRQEAKLRQALERYTDVPVLGAVGRDAALVVEERHLGLTPPAELDSRDATIGRLAVAVAQGIDLDRVLAIAREAPRLPETNRPLASSRVADIRIAVARDAAFGFYYQDDFEALTDAGAELVFFDTLRGDGPPAADGMVIGGGFPETQMAALSNNRSMRAAIRALAESGLPIYAECGGLMYLTRGIAWGDRCHDMVGFLPADTVMHGAPRGRGLVVLEETGELPWPKARAPASGRIAAHEFHYASLERVDPACRYAYRVSRGTGIGGGLDGLVRGGVVAGFSHQRSTAKGGSWAERFVAFVRDRKRAR